MRYLPRLTAGLLVAGIAVACSEVTTIVDQASEFQTTLAVYSRIIDATGDTLVGDSVQFSSSVKRDGQPYATSAPRFESSDPSVVRILDPATGEAVFEGTGQALVSVTFTERVFPDSLLRAAMQVTVDSLTLDVSLESPILEAGDTLVGDTVQFEASVKRKDGREVPTQARYASSDTTVVKFVGPSSGLAALVGPGTADVTVTIEEPIVPGGPLSASVPLSVSDFGVVLSLSSISSGSIEEGDTLVTDSVQFSLTVQKDGEPVTVVDPTFVSSNPSVVQILNPQTGRAVFPETGIAVVTVSFTEPDLPIQSASMLVRVTTYLASISGPTSPVMGDVVEYTASVIDTRSGLPVGTSGREFSSTNPSVLQVLDSDDGEVFVRDTGEAEMRVTFDKPALPYGPVTGSLSVNVTEERFYGNSSEYKGDFGDDVRLSSSAVHRFTGATWIEFPNGTVGFISQVTSSQLDFTVPAGASSGRLRLHNLVDEEGDPRDNVLTYWTFESEGTVEDAFEPNDALPLDKDVRIKYVPWVQLLSSDPSKAAPADTNFFWFRLSMTYPFDFIAEWQQDADLDFKLCLGKGDPPKEYILGTDGQPICARGPGDNSRHRRREEATALMLQPGTWILAFYCVDCPDVPLTYRVEFDVASEEMSEGGGGPPLEPY